MANKNMFGMGWKKDPYDARDFNIRQLLPPLKIALPEEFIVYSDTIIYDQGQTPRCVAYASSGVKTDEEFLQWGHRYKFNADWLYSECKKQDGIPNEDGTFPRVACQILQSEGDVLDTSSVSTCFLCKKKDPITPVPDMKWSIQAYYRIDSSNTDDAIKQIIYQYGSFLAASDWYNNWFNKFSIFPIPEGNAEGGHCYRIIGWDKNGWVVANSWGTLLWGVNGMATMPYSIFRQYVLSEGDCWKLVDNK
jgi:C1A family cysteine protease